MADTPPPMPAVPSGPATTSVSLTSDFHDRLSPMLVKELRQGLRAKTFVSVFLALQGFLAFVLLTAAAGTNQSSGGNTISGIIFFFFSITATIIQPLRGIGALNAEIKGNTIELMVLTRLSAWRIVLGKWVSLVSQTGLLLVAVIPYIILRYFFGGMQLFAELLMLFTVFFASSVLTAITVGLSGIGSILVRGLLPLIGAFILMISIWNLAFDVGFVRLAEPFTLQSSTAVWAILVSYCTGAYVAWLALGLGASIIAPAAENHSTARRLVSMAAVLTILITAHIRNHHSEAEIIILLSLTAAPVVILSLTEPFQLLPPICQRFSKFGTAGRIAGRFLYPGWPSGTLFSIILIGLSCLCFGSSREFYTPDSAIFLVSSAGTLLFPTAAMGLFERKIKNRFAIYLLVLVLCVIISIIATIVSLSTDMKGLLWAFAWLPPVIPMLKEAFRIPSQDAMLISTITSSIYGVISLIFAVARFGRISEIERQIQPSSSHP